MANNVLPDPLNVNIASPDPLNTSIVNQSAFSTTAFGELSVAQNKPLIQITAQYGLLEDVLTPTIGGTATTVDSKFSLSTGVGASNVAAIVSSREAQYKAGQGLLARFTSIFTDGVANSTQQAGLITSESIFGFGYNGAEFGIVHARGGELECQELTITTSAAGAENAIVTVDGAPYAVAISSGTAQDNAYEISVSLSSQVPGYIFTSNNNVVTALAQLPDFGSGAFAFVSGTAIGAWAEIQSGTLPVETWVNKTDWNVNPGIVINTALGNVYQVQMQYLGFGGIRFYIENQQTAAFELVHVIQYANTDTVPSVSNPIFRVGWAARNSGNTTDIIVQGASAAVFIEGIVAFDGLPRGLCQTQLSVTTTRTNVIALRNRITFNNTANRAEIVPILLSLATDSSKTAFFEIVANPETLFGDTLDWNYVDSSKSLMEFADDNVFITGGDVIACFSVRNTGSLLVDMQKILEAQRPGAAFSITARVSSGSSADMDASPVWREDL